MDEIVALILGIIQGLTEFLPVSSSGHIELGKKILGSNLISSENILFTVVVHFGTALSTIVVFKKDIYQLLKKAFRPSINKENKFILNIFISMIPAVIVGLYFEEELELLFNGNILLVGSMLIITGILLLTTRKAKENKKEMRYIDSVIIGISQAFAILPGISRSGATISTSLILGINKQDAAKFSFLMVIPLIIGKIFKDVFFNKDISYDNMDLNVFIIGFFSSFITGILACKWMMKLVKGNKLNYFAYYCFFVGTLAIISTRFEGNVIIEKPQDIINHESELLKT